MSDKPPDGLYEVHRVGDCERCGGRGEFWLTRSVETDPTANVPPTTQEAKTCPICHGDGGRYELRPDDKGVDE